MSPSQSITQTIILRLKEDVNLEDVTSTDTSPIAKAFIELVNILKAQDGFIRQFWGHQVEDPRNFVWSVDKSAPRRISADYWESYSRWTTFSNSDQHNRFLTLSDLIFDTKAGPPLTFHTNFTSNSLAAFTAPVTEVAFFTAPEAKREQAQAVIENMIVSSTDPIITVGKASGGAVGWVFDTETPNNAAPEGEFVALHGVFGYDSVADHFRWRETPEHAGVIWDIARSPLGELGLGNARVPGGNIFVLDSSMFHVEFRAGL